MYPSYIRPSICEFFFILLIFCKLFCTTLSANVVDQQYANCATFNSPCNPSINISYPFWDSTRPSYCGHPEFMLKCQESALTIQMKNQTYNVLNISYDSYTLTLLKPAFLQGPCPQTQTQLTNTTLDLNFFNLTSESRNAYLFYNCVNKNLSFVPPYSFSCQQNTGYNAPATFTSVNNFLAVDEKYEGELTENCNIKVYVPVFNNMVQKLISSNLSALIKDVVSKGFEVKWLIDESQCKVCSDSNGRCGFNQSFICLCPSGVQSKICPRSDAIQGIEHSSGQYQGTRKLVVIGIGVAAAVGGLILLSILFILYQRRYKHKKSSVGFLRKLSNTFSATLDPNASTVFGVHVFSYSELEEATEHFNPTIQLGEGGFGAVYYGKLQDGREVAIKRLYDSNRRRTQQFLNEVEILANLRHPNLVTLYGCTSHQSKELLLVYEYVPNGTVADHLHGKKAKLSLLPWATRLNIAIESASALVYLHDSDIIHRDVKTQNILLDKDFSVKVADFGLSRLFPLDVTHVSTAPQGTPGYVDPEYHQCYHLTEKSDVYSFGVVLAELISSKPAVDITRRRTEINLSNMLINMIRDQVLHELVDPSLGFDTDFKVKKQMTAVGELALQCLQSTRDMRPSMEQVLDRLYRIRDKINKLDRPDVLDIPSDDVFMLKGDFSPTSPKMIQ